MKFFEKLIITKGIGRFDLFFCLVAITSNSIFSFGQESSNTAAGDIVGSGGSVAFRAEDEC